MSASPPFAVSELDLDEFGSLRLVDDNPSDELLDAFEQWLARGCGHPNMRLVDFYWSASGLSIAGAPEVVRRLLSDSRFALLAELLERPVPDHLILVTPEEAPALLTQAIEFLEQPSGLTTRVLTDLSKNVSPPIDRDGYDDQEGFTPLCNVKFSRAPVTGMCEIGVSGLQFVVRDATLTDHEWIRSRSLAIQQIDNRGELTVDGHRLYQTVFLPSGGQKTHWGLAPWFSIFFDQATHLPKKKYVSRIKRIELREIPIVELAPYVEALRVILKASVESGNPVVGLSL